MVPRRSPQSKQKKAQQSDIEHLATLYVQARSLLVRVGGALHDHIGSSLSAAGIQLQLLRMDVPSARKRVDETLRTLEEVLSRVRDLSQELCPSPAYRGALKQGLLRLADRYGLNNCQIAVEYSATAAVPPEIAVAVYESACSVVQQALGQGATRVRVSLRGKAGLVLRIAHDGRKSGHARGLAAIRALVVGQGLTFDCTTGKSTIVSIRYAIRRTPRG